MKLPMTEDPQRIGIIELKVVKVYVQVMGCEQESPTGVHLDSEVGWVKRMHLCIEGIKISYREIEMF